MLQSVIDAEDAVRLVLARELTIEEKREFVDLRIEGWLGEAASFGSPFAGRPPGGGAP